MINLTFKRGFTLAEVLITLGIIGVVAALTIPTLLANINGVQYRTKFKKEISTLNQAVRMNKAQHDFDFGDLTRYGCHSLGDNPETYKTICAVLNGGLSGHTGLNYTLGYTDETGDFDYKIIRPAQGQHDFFGGAPSDFNRPNAIQYSLSDGAIVISIDPVIDVESDYGCYGSLERAYESACYGFIDVNGLSGPNREVQCATGTTMEVTDPNYSGCSVDNRTIGDIYPIIYYDGTVEPLTNAAKDVLEKAK